MTSNYTLKSPIAAAEIGIKSQRLETADNALLQLEVLQLISPDQDDAHFKCDFNFEDFSFYREDPAEWENAQIPCTVSLRLSTQGGGLFVPMGTGAPQVRVGTELTLHAHRISDGEFQQHITAVRTYEGWNVLECEKVVAGGARVKPNPEYPNIALGELNSALTSLATAAHYVLG